MPDEVSKKLGEANLMYATRRYKEAMDLLNDVIKDVSHLMKCETLKCEPHAAYILIMDVRGCAQYLQVQEI